MTSNLVSGPDGLMDAAMAAWVEAPSNAISYMAGIRAVAMLVRNRSDDVPTKICRAFCENAIRREWPIFSK
jgi:hypothetical protein